MTPRLRFLQEIYQSCRQKKVDPRSYMQLRVQRLPFKLGEGKRKVPFLIAPEVETIIGTSMQYLVDLIKRRNERESRSPLQTYMPLATPRRPKDLMERYLCTRDLSARPLEKRIAEDAILHNPYLDAGIVEGWFLQNREASKLTWTIQRLYTKAIEEEIKHEGWEDTTYLTHLCLIYHVRNLKEGLKKINIRGFSYERLEQAVGQMFYSLFKEMQNLVFDEIRYKDLSIDISRLEHLIKGSTNPLTFVAIKPSLFKNDLNPYYLDQEAYNLLQEQASDLNLDFYEIEESLKELTNRVKKNKQLREKLIDLWCIKKIRLAVFNYLKDFEDYSKGKDLWLYHLVQSNKVIYATLTSEETERRFEEDLARLMAETSRSFDKERAQRVADLDKAFKLQKKGRAYRKLFFGTKEEEQIREIVEGYILYRLDELWSSWVDESLEYLDDRLTLKSREDLEDEYEQGRIYRLSTDNRSLLRDLTIKKEGHLFMDLRGFTQRMCRAKEITTADFMLKEFFLPVLETARRYSTNEGVRLNNLVGDAFSFSGKISSLVSLAQELRIIFDKCAEEIKRREKQSVSEEALRAIKERYVNERKAIIQQRIEIEKTIQGIEEELKAKEFINPMYIFKAQEEEFDIKYSYYQQQLNSLQQHIENETNPQRKKELIRQYHRLNAFKEAIEEQKKELLSRINTYSSDDLNEIFRLICAEDKKELERLKKLLRKTYDREMALNRAYEAEIAQQNDVGIEYGLFISYGDAAESIVFEDPYWGKMNVAIAEKLNEAARGTGRNPTIKRKLETLLGTARRARGSPNLTYPFHVFIDRGFGLSFRPDLSSMIERLLNTHDSKIAQAIIDTTSSLLMNDIEKGMRGAMEGEWEVLNYFNDIYNLGEAISGEALQAYLREISPHKYYFIKTVRIEELHPEIKQQFFFPSPELQFTICIQRESVQLDFELFRYVGELVFRGFEMHQPTTVYEIIRKSSPFYQMLQQYHLHEWLKEKKDGRAIKSAHA